jgi:hypothetical protein
MKIESRSNATFFCGENYKMGLLLVAGFYLCIKFFIQQHFFLMSHQTTILLPVSYYLPYH